MAEDPDQKQSRRAAILSKLPAQQVPLAGPAAVFRGYMLAEWAVAAMAFANAGSNTAEGAVSFRQFGRSKTKRDPKHSFGPRFLLVLGEDPSEPPARTRRENIALLTTGEH